MDEVLEVYQYTVNYDDTVRYILAKDAHEAAELAGMNCGGTQNLKNIELSYEQ